MRLLTWAITLVAAVVTVWVAVIVITGQSSSSSVAWSEPNCPTSNNKVGFNRTIKEGSLIIRFSTLDGDCNQITATEAKEAQRRLKANFNKLTNIGVPNPARGRHIQLVRSLPRDSVRAYTNYQFNRSADGVSSADINLLANISDQLLIYVQAQLVLAEIAPGLSDQARQRLAGALTRTALGRPVGPIEESSVDITGSYESWLIDQLGDRFFLKALSNCYRRCSWAQVRDQAILEEGKNPEQLRQQWLNRIPLNRRATIEKIISGG